MMNVRYGITEETYTSGANARTSYGVAAYADPDEDGTATIVAAVHDVTSDRTRLAALVDLCNRLGLSTIHLYDVIEDFLSE